MATKTYTTYVLLGKTQAESEKLYAPSQWMAVYPILDKFFRSYDLMAAINSDQAMGVIKKIDPKRGWRVTFKNVATGGIQKWSEKANRKIGTPQMQAHFDLIRQADAKNQTWYDYIAEKFPEIGQYFRFQDLKVMGYLDHSVNIKHMPPADFYLYLTNAIHPNDTWDQEVSIMVSDDLPDQAREDIEALIEELKPIMHAVGGSKARLLGEKIITEKFGDVETPKQFGIYFRSFGQPGSLEMRTAEHLQLTDWKSF